MDICKLGGKKIATEIVKQLEDVAELKKQNQILVRELHLYQERINNCNPYGDGDFFCIECGLCYDMIKVESTSTVYDNPLLRLCIFCIHHRVMKKCYKK